MGESPLTKTDRVLVTPQTPTNQKNEPLTLMELTWFAVAIY
jgi:hypothetical protein